MTETSSLILGSPHSQEADLLEDIKVLLIKKLNTLFDKRLSNILLQAGSKKTGGSFLRTVYCLFSF